MADLPLLITKHSCSNCFAAKKQFDKFSIPVDMRNVDDDPAAAKLASDAGVVSAPALFADGQWYRTMHQILGWIRVNRTLK